MKFYNCGSSIEEEISPQNGTGCSDSDVECSSHGPRCQIHANHKERCQSYGSCNGNVTQFPHHRPQCQSNNGGFPSHRLWCHGNNEEFPSHGPWCRSNHAEFPRQAPWYCGNNGHFPRHGLWCRGNNAQVPNHGPRCHDIRAQFPCHGTWYPKNCAGSSVIIEECSSSGISCTENPSQWAELLTCHGSEVDGSGSGRNVTKRSSSGRNVADRSGSGRNNRHFSIHGPRCHGIRPQFPGHGRWYLKNCVESPPIIEECSSGEISCTESSNQWAELQSSEVEHSGSEINVTKRSSSDRKKGKRPGSGRNRAKRSGSGGNGAEHRGSGRNRVENAGSGIDETELHRNKSRHHVAYSPP